jgi:hypothetical protein
MISRLVRLLRKLDYRFNTERIEEWAFLHAAGKYLSEWPGHFTSEDIRRVLMSRGENEDEENEDEESLLVWEPFENYDGGDVIDLIETEARSVIKTWYG